MPRCPTSTTRAGCWQPRCTTAPRRWAPPSGTTRRWRGRGTTSWWSAATWDYVPKPSGAPSSPGPTTSPRGQPAAQPGGGAALEHRQALPRSSSRPPASRSCRPSSSSRGEGPRHRFEEVEHVVKPVVSAGSRDTLRIGPGEVDRSSRPRRFPARRGPRGDGAALPPRGRPARRDRAAAPRRSASPTRCARGPCSPPGWTSSEGLYARGGHVGPRALAGRAGAGPTAVLAAVPDRSRRGPPLRPGRPAALPRRVRGCSSSS